MFRMVKKYSHQDEFNASHYSLLDSLVVGILRYVSTLLNDPDFCTQNSSNNAQILKELCTNSSDTVANEARNVIVLYAEQGLKEIRTGPSHYTFPIILFNLYQVVFITWSHH